MSPLGDEGACARAALRLSLAPQAGLVCTALREPRAEVRDIRLDFPGSTIATVIAWETLGPGPAADRLGIEYWCAP